MASEVSVGVLFAPAVSNLPITKNWVKQTSKQIDETNKQTNKQTNNIRKTLQTFTSKIEQLPGQLQDYYASIWLI